jgi:hypothetical protein
MKLPHGHLSYISLTSLDTIMHPIFQIISMNEEGRSLTCPGRSASRVESSICDNWATFFTSTLIWKTRPAHVMIFILQPLIVNKWIKSCGGSRTESCVPHQTDRSNSDVATSPASTCENCWLVFVKTTVKTEHWNICSHKNNSYRSINDDPTKVNS